MRSLLVALAFVLAYPSLAAESAAELIAALPAKAKVEIMEIAPSPRLVELSMKMKAAVAKDPDWFVQHVAQAEEGEALPWDARLGLTREEYAELLGQARKLTLQKTGDATIEFSRAENGRVTIIAAGDLSDLSGIEIDLAANTVKTPFGTATAAPPVEASDEQNATGPWNGVSWRLERMTDDEVTHAQLSLGRRVADGRAILYYKATQAADGAAKKVRTLLFFDFAAK